jgi:hypothetical protein
VITFPGSSSDDTSVPVCGDTVPLSPFVPGQDGKSPVVALPIAARPGRTGPAWELSGPSGL